MNREPFAGGRGQSWKHDVVGIICISGQATFVEQQGSLGTAHVPLRCNIDAGNIDTGMLEGKMMNFIKEEMQE
jgi:hypothetical protein